MYRYSISYNDGTHHWYQAPGRKRRYYGRDPETTYAVACDLAQTELYVRILIEERVGYKWCANRTMSLSEFHIHQKEKYNYVP